MPSRGCFHSFNKTEIGCFYYFRYDGMFGLLLSLSVLPCYFVVAEMMKINSLGFLLMWLGNASWRKFPVVLMFLKFLLG
jgi:hypothetical protein